MLDISFIRSNPEVVEAMCRQRQVDFNVSSFLDLDKRRRELRTRVEELSSAKNKANQEISRGNKELLSEMKKIDVQHDELIQQLKPLEEEWERLLYLLPNLISADVQEKDVVIKETPKKKFSFAPRPYLDVAGDLIDTKRAAKISGTRFGFTYGDLVLLQFSLLKLVFEITAKKGFIPVMAPTMIRPEMMRGMGYMERGGDEIYYLEKDNLYLTGTPEQPLGSMHADEVMTELPRRYVSFSSCYRREAGSHGKDTKGILRVHQFEKVEMFSYVDLDNSDKELELMLGIEEEIMKKLDLPYRVLLIGAPDLGDPAYKKYDIEAWMPGQNEYRETHSASNCTDFQSRRLNIKDQSKRYVHTVNATGLAMGRILIAIIENYQQANGRISVPKVLQRSMGKKII